VPKYLLEASYTGTGVQGLMKDGGSKRRAAAKTLIESLGGKLEALYYAFGETDVIAVADLPDNAAAAAASLTISGSGSLRGKITVLLTPEEVDHAVKKSASYTPPGR
jgi:uncharacterized protein with GYD domain